MKNEQKERLTAREMIIEYLSNLNKIWDLRLNTAISILMERFANQETAHLRQELQERLKLQVQLEAELELVKAQMDHLSRAMNALNVGMIDAYRGHDYLKMYEIWETLLSFTKE